MKKYMKDSIFCFVIGFWSLIMAFLIFNRFPFSTYISIDGIVALFVGVLGIFVGICMSYSFLKSQNETSEEK